MSKSRYYKNSKGEQIDFSVNVVTCPNFRDGPDNLLIHQTKEALRKMFDDFVIDPMTVSLNLEYPERWANLSELKSLSSRMILCFPNLSEATIKTHSTSLIRSVHHDHIMILDSPVRDYHRMPEEFKNLKIPTVDYLM
jgi:hypothetical protein